MRHGILGRSPKEDIMTDESPIRDARPVTRALPAGIDPIPLATRELIDDKIRAATHPQSRAAYMRAWRASKQSPSPDMPPGRVAEVAGAVSAIAAALEPLDPESRQRALDAVVAILG